MSLKRNSRLPVPHERDMIMRMARDAESNNAWCWAAILWRRVGERSEAESCEDIAQYVAEGKATMLER